MSEVSTSNVHEISAAGGGLVIGNSATELIALHGATPVDQAAAITSPAATAATSSTPFGYSEAQANAIVTAVNSMLTALREKGIIAT